MVVSDAHLDLRQAMSEVLTRARVAAAQGAHHSARAQPGGALQQQSMVAAIIRTIFAQPTQKAARAQLRRASNSSKTSFRRP